MATTNSWNNAIAAANSAITLNSGTNTVSISTDASATTVNIATGGAVKGVTLGSTNSTSATTIQSGSGALNITSTNGAQTHNSGTGAMNISTDASATTISIGTGAAVKALTIGSTNTTSSTTINFGGSSGSALSNYIATTSWTPVLAFGGGSTGITYSTQLGRYARIGSVVFFAFQITLTNKGSSTGNCAITGLPVAAGAFFQDMAISASALTYTGNSIYGFIASGGTSVIIGTNTTAAAAVATLTDVAFANTTVVVCSGSYLV